MQVVKMGWVYEQLPATVHGQVWRRKFLCLKEKQVQIFDTMPVSFKTANSLPFTKWLVLYILSGGDQSCRGEGGSSCTQLRDGGENSNSLIVQLIKRNAYRGLWARARTLWITPFVVSGECSRVGKARELLQSAGNDSTSH